MTMQAIEIMADSNRGVYIPQHFIESCADGWLNGIDADDIACVALGPDDNEQYWDAWVMVLDNASYTASNGDVYTLYQDGDLFAICFDKLTDEQRDNMGFNDND